MMNAKTEYACIAMVVLAMAKARGKSVVTVRSIAEEHGISSRFLVVIMLELKGAGMVTSIRGAKGGYTLAVNPRCVTISQIVDIFNGEVMNDSHASCDTSVIKGILQLTQNVEKQRQKTLSMSLSTFIKKMVK